MCAENEYFDCFRVNTLEVSVVLILFFWGDKKTARVLSIRKIVLSLPKNTKPLFVLVFFIV